ncbi:hypothetical protein QBC39DRAFT_146133 [Podospora conica]|nr:hypothetical protein QBC39DRAFT_146133 [Schizothecium conicum]
MAPIRRYLRITKFSVLEVRIYLDNPALAQTWLLNPRNPVLPRVMESVRPLVLPKLREERDRERSRKKNKKRSIKDVVVEDDFEVSIFLTTTETRHSLLYKRKIFRDKTQTKLTSNSSKLTGATHDEPIDVDGQTAAHDDDDVQILREEDDDDPDQHPINLDDIPDAPEIPGSRRSKRRRQDSTAAPGEDQQTSDDGADSDQDGDESDQDLFVSGGGEEEMGSERTGPPPPKRRKGKEPAADDDGTDDKKKLAMDISYEGFGIYGRVLCLVIKRRDGGKTVAPSSGAGPSGGGRSQASARPGGQASMENWITSTQMPETNEEEAM